MQSTVSTAIVLLFGLQLCWNCSSLLSAVQMARSSNYPLTDLTIYRFNITWVLRFAPWSFAEERKHWDAALRGCDFFVSCDSVVPLKRDSNHLSSLPGIPLPLHAGLFSFVPAGTWPCRQHEIVCRLRLSIAVASRWIDPSASQAQRQNDRGRETFG